MSVLEVGVVPGAVARVARLEVLEQGLELLLLVAAEHQCLEACGEGLEYDWVQERASSDVELIEGEGDSECGFLEILEAIWENSQDRKDWTFVLETLVLDRQMEPKAYSFLV